MPDHLTTPRIELPADWIPEGVICALVPIPDDPEFLAQLVGLIDQLRFSRSFARDATATGAATVARTWDKALATGPIVTVDCEGVTALFDVRQNPDEPCILEKSTDGGITWVPWADLTLCPPLLQISADGTGIDVWCPTCDDGNGAWVPLGNPQADYDPAYDDAQTPVPEGWADPMAEPCCVFAANATDAFKSVMERIDYGLYTGALAQVIWNVANGVYGIMQRIMSKKVLQILTDIIANAVVDYATWHADYEDFDWAELTNILCCAYGEDGTVSAADFSAMQALMASKSSPVWNMIKLLLPLIGPVGLNNASTYSGIQYAECDPDCDPDLSECWDYRYDDHDIVPVAGKGTWVPRPTGSGWKGQLNGGGTAYELDITGTTGIPGGTIDTMRVDFSFTGNSKHLQIYVNGTLKYEAFGGSAGYRVATFPVGAAVSSFRIVMSQNTLNTAVYAIRTCFYRT